MKRIALIAALTVVACAVGFGQSAANPASQADTKTSATSKPKHHEKWKRTDVPVDIDITPDSTGNPTAPDATVHRSKHEVARWINKMDRSCDVSFSPFAKSHYHILKDGKKSSGTILGPNGTYNYWISCDAKRKGSKPVKIDPAIIVND